jgi:threo-3-hydroxy-L-aspartate ammonia-lyase
VIGAQYSDVGDPPDPVPARTVATVEAPDEPALVTIDAIRAAAQGLRGVSLRTPLVPMGPPSAGPRLLLKAESLQPIGAFKIRGAYHAIASLPAERRSRGVVTHSSGNHGQGVARAGRLLDVHTIVVMPADVSPLKLGRVRADGAEVVLVGPSNDERAARAAEIARDREMTLIPPYDDPAIIAGQGTAGLEIVEQVAELGLGPAPEAACGPDGDGLLVIVPIGGGGLASGVATAVRSLLPRASVWGVEPALAADAQESLAAGRLIRWEPERVGRTIADGMRPASIGRLPFAHLRRYLDGVVTVEEDEICRAMARAADEGRLVVEPSGATAIAAWLFHASELPDVRTVVCVVSGGNVDPDRYVELTARGRAAGG